MQGQHMQDDLAECTTDQKTAAGGGGEPLVPDAEKLHDG